MNQVKAKKSWNNINAISNTDTWQNNIQMSKCVKFYKGHKWRTVTDTPLMHPMKVILFIYSINVYIKIYAFIVVVGIMIFIIFVRS